MGGKKPFALAGYAAWIDAQLAQKPDITGRALLAELQAKGVHVTHYGGWHRVDLCILDKAVGEPSSY